MNGISPVPTRSISLIPSALSRAAWLRLHVPLILSGLLVLVGLNNYLLFHTLAELFSVVIAVSAFVVAWNAFSFSRNHFLLYLGIGLFWVGALDLVHTLLYKGMHVFPGESANPPTQFWIGTRYLFALLLLSAPAFLSRSIRRWPVMLAYGATATLIGGLIFSGRFPDAYVDGQGLTRFKIVSEYIANAMLLTGAVYLYRRRALVDPRIRALITVSIFLAMAAGFAFTFYVSVYGLSNLLGHVFRLFAYWFIYFALVEFALTQPFRILAQGATTYEAVPDPTVVVDREGIVRQSNRAACRAAGFVGGECIGLSVHELLHPPQLPATECPACQHISRGEPAEGIEIEFPGTARWIEVTLSPVSREKEAAGMVHVNRDITDRKRHTTERERLLYQLNLRVKELRCLYTISELLEQHGLSLDEIMTGIVGRMPPGLQYPEVARARIRLDNQTFATPGFEDTPWRLTADIAVPGTPAGTLELCYLEQKAEADEGPFLKEERALINAVAERTGKVLQRMRSQQQIDRLTRLYVTLSQTNEAIVRCTDRDELLPRVCRIAVEQGGFDCAYVGMLDESRTRIRIVAHHGRGSVEVQLIEDAVEDVRTSPGRIATAIREGRITHTNDYQAEPSSSAWGEAALRLGFRGAAALPLRLNGEVVGVLGLYVGEKGFFDEAQLKLLGEMAMDISFALDNFDREARRRLSEQALKESEEKFRQVSASAQDAVIVIDEDGLITDWNRAAERIFQYPAADAVGKNMHRLLAPARYHEAIDRGLKGFKRFGSGPVINQTLELSALRGDGVEIPVELSISALQIKGSWHAVGLVRDISERLEARRRLEKLAHDQELLLQSTDQGIYGLDTQGHCSFINHAAARMLGLQPGKILGQDMHTSTHHSRADGTPYPAEACPIYVAFRTGQGCRVDGEVFWRSDGTSFPVEYSSFPVIQQGQVIGAVVTFSDISERRRAEEALRRSAASLAEAQRIAHLGDWNWDIVANTLRWSDEIYRIFGLQPQEFGSTYPAFLAAVHPDDRGLVQEAVDHALRREAEYGIDHRIVLPDGTVRHVHEQAEVAFDATGKPLRMVGTVQDVTEQRQGEIALRKLNRALACLSRCNEALIHATEEPALLTEMCRIIVEVGGYRLAWVGHAENDAAKSVRPVAQFGYEEGYLERANITWADTERGRGPVGTAIRSGRIQVVGDTAADPGFAPWRDNALRLGYATVLALPLAHEAEVFGVLAIYGTEPNAFDEAEIRLLSELADDLAFGIVTLREREDRRRTRLRLERSMERTIQAIALALEKRDPYTAGHQRRVAELAVAIAQELGLPDEQIKGVHFGATIHDIGKIYVPAEILTRPGRLMQGEFELIKSHPQVGYEIVQGVEFPWPVAEMILQHHERLDGTGYPSGLKGEEIALEARILAVADVVEAMSSHRPYRAALGVAKALEEIEAGRGTRYEGRVADACIRLFRGEGFDWREQRGPG